VARNSQIQTPLQRRAVNRLTCISLLLVSIPKLLLILMYLLTAVGLTPGGSIHLHTNNTQNNTNNNRTTQITTNVEECGPCPAFASFTLAFALQMRKKHGKTSVRVRKTSVRSQSTVYIIPKHPHITKPTQTQTHTHTYTQTNTLRRS